MTGPNRRTFLGHAASLTGLAATSAVLPVGLIDGAVQAQTSDLLGKRHGLSIFNDLAKPVDFTHFPYVDPDAPKGGSIVMSAPNWFFNQNPLTFNTLNGYVTRGDAAPRPELTFDRLMVTAADEPDAVYGLVAESVSIGDDGLTYTFHLRDTPRFHDGSPLTAHDVVWSMETLKAKGHPDMRLPLKQLESVEAPDERTVIVKLAADASSQLATTVATLPIFSATWWEGKDFEASTLTPVLGSGPYKVGNFSAPTFIEYDRVPDYWAADLPVMRGQNNFDKIRIEFFRERQAGFEAFKKGDLTFKEEFVSKTWATEYGFPAAEAGKVVKETIPAEKRPNLQAWFINTRRKKFADPRTRQAIGLAFDFEWVNANLFYESYQRSASYFQSSAYQADGFPSEEELAILEPFRGQVPDAVFGEAVSPSPSDGSGRDRQRLRQAVQLLADAGWKRNGNRLEDASGNVLSVEFLINAPTFERVLGGYVEALRSIGVEATINLVDAAQFQSRMNDYDYDIVGRRWSLSPTPIEGIRLFFSSGSADTPGSNNLSGINDPAVDALVDQVLAAEDRDTHRTLLRALDRVLRASYYIIPNWHSDTHRIATWDQFSRPAMKPDYAFPVETTWWYDREKAERIGTAD